MTKLGVIHGPSHDRPTHRRRQSASTDTARNAVTYRPILPQILRHIWRCLTQPDRPEPAPQQAPETFQQLIDYIVHTDKHGNKTEHIRYHVDIDNNHTIECTFPLRELNWPLPEWHLDDEEVGRDNCA